MTCITWWRHVVSCCWLFLVELELIIMHFNSLCIIVPTSVEGKTVKQAWHSDLQRKRKMQVWRISCVHAVSTVKTLNAKFRESAGLMQVASLTAMQVELLGTCHLVPDLISRGGSRTKFIGYPEFGLNSAKEKRSWGKKETRRRGSERRRDEETERRRDGDTERRRHGDRHGSDMYSMYDVVRYG